MDPLYELALTIKAGHRELDRLMNEAMRPLGLTAAQADALDVVGRAGPVSLRELGELLVAESGHPSRLVDRLVEAGLVERRPGRDDRRRVELSLTARGRSVRERVTETRQAVLDVGRAMLGDADLEPALVVLRSLLAQTPSAGLVERRRELLERDG